MNPLSVRYSRNAANAVVSMSLWLEYEGTSLFVGYARRLRGRGWLATILFDRSGSVDFTHQQPIGVYTTAMDAALALLCSEDAVRRALEAA